MFRAFLGYFQGEVAFVDHFLLDAFHLVPEHKGISGAAFGLERVQLHGVYRLLHGHGGIAVGFEAPDEGGDIGTVLEGDGLLGAKGYFAQFGGRRNRSMPKASAVLKADPVLWALRTLSRTRTMPEASLRRYSSGLILPSSIFKSFLSFTLQR